MACTFARPEVLSSAFTSAQAAVRGNHLLLPLFDPLVQSRGNTWVMHGRRGWLHFVLITTTLCGKSRSSAATTGAIRLGLPSIGVTINDSNARSVVPGHEIQLHARCKMGSPSPVSTSNELTELATFFSVS